MTESRYRLPELPTRTPILRNRVIVWRGERELMLLDDQGPRRIAADWAIDRVELTADGRYVLALGDSHRRAQVWDTRSGARVLDIVGDERRHSLHGGLAMIGDATYALTAVRNRTISIADVRDGSNRGWLSITGYIWFQVDRVLGLNPAWLAVVCHIEGEQYDTVLVLPAVPALDDNQAIMTALSETQTIKEWGYSVAVGPVGADGAVIFRDAHWTDDDDVPDDPAEAFRGLVLYDLRSGRVCERITHEPITQGATLGGDATRVAIEHPDHIEIIARAGYDGAPVHRIEAIALDPVRLELARVSASELIITPLP